MIIMRQHNACRHDKQVDSVESLKVAAWRQCCAHMYRPVSKVVIKQTVQQFASLDSTEFPNVSAVCRLSALEQLSMMTAQMLPFV